MRKNSGNRNWVCKFVGALCSTNKTQKVFFHKAFYKGSTGHKDKA